MKPGRPFFFFIDLPSLRFLIPAVFVTVFVAASFAVLSHREATTLPAPATVMVDPGHGGYDPGVKLPEITEADLTLAIGKKLQATLMKRGVTAQLTRTSDDDFADSGTRGSRSKRSDLEQRIALTEAAQAKLFISLHANSSSLATRGGAEVFYNSAVRGAKELALNVQRELHKLPSMSKREAKAASYYLLKHQSIPALIIECGYLNFADERARLSSDEYQQLIAEAIAAGITQSLDDQALDKKEEGQ